MAAVAALGLMASGAIGSSPVQAAPSVVFDAIGATVPSNFSPSQPFDAAQVNEFGDLVTLEPGGPRELTKVSVALSSQACQNGLTLPCTTAEGATFTHPLTIKLYNVGGTPAAPTVGSVFATATQTFTIPFRPSANTDCGTTAPALDPTRWMDDQGVCWTGKAVVVDFVFPAGTTLPDEVIWGISFSTEQAGPPPNADGPADLLNVGVSTTAPTVGTNTDTNVNFISSIATGDAFVAQPADGGGPMARISAQVPQAAPVPPATTPPTTPPPGALPDTGY
jgi:hypothetical protein